MESPSRLADGGHHDPRGQFDLCQVHRLGRGVGVRHRAGAEHHRRHPGARQFAGVRAEGHALDVARAAVGGEGVAQRGDEKGVGWGVQGRVDREWGVHLGPQGGELVAVLVPDGHRVLAGERTAVDVHLAAAGDRVVARAAADPGDRPCGGSEERVRCDDGAGGGEVGDDGGHQRDRVHRLLGPRTVPGPATGAHGVAHDALVGGGRHQPGGLADQRADDMAVGQRFEQVQDTPVGVFLVADPGQDDRERRRPAAGEFGGGQHERGERPLGVAGTPSVQPAVADLTVVGRDRHAVRLDRVEVRFEQHHRRVPAGNDGHHVAPTWQHLVHLGLYAVPAQPVADMGGHRRLSPAARSAPGVHAGDTDEIADEVPYSVGGVPGRRGRHVLRSLA